MAGWITYKSAADILDCDEETVPRLVRDGKLVGRAVPHARPKVRLDSVMRLLEASITVPPAPADEPTPVGAAS